MIECWKHLKSLEELRFSDCSELEVLSSLAEMTSLKHFQLGKCSKLKKMEGLENIKSLEKLEIGDCSELKALPEITSLKKLQLEKCVKKIEGLENMGSLEELNISDCSELETLPEITSLKILELKRCPGLKKIDGLRKMKSVEKLNISDCSELESLPSLSEITSLKVLKLEKYYKLEKVEGLERLEKLEVHTWWNAPCIVNLQHSQSLQSLVVVANNISVIEPFVTSIQKWPRNVMICTRPVCDMGLLKNFFENLPNVSVLDYTVGVEVDYFGGKHLELRAPKSSARGNAILRCFIIDSDHPDLRLSIKLGPYDANFKTELGEGKWVWMGVYTHFYPWGSSFDENHIFARNSEGEDVKVKVEAAWFVTGEERSIVDAFRQHFQRWTKNELSTEEASIAV